MSMLKRTVATILGSLALVVLPAHGQGTFPGIGDDMTSSLGSFKIQVANQFAPLFASCPPALYDPSSRIFSSPTLSDQGTIIGRSNVTLDDSPFRKGSVPAGSTRMVVPGGYSDPAAGLSMLRQHQLRIRSRHARGPHGNPLADDDCVASGPAGYGASWDALR